MHEIIVSLGLFAEGTPGAADRGQQQTIALFADENRINALEFQFARDADRLIATVGKNLGFSAHC